MGAVGVCVQKVSEAEAMVYGGVRDVLVTNEVVGRQKLQRLMSLAHNARVGVCVDDLGQVRALDAAAGEAGVGLPVYVVVNMGGKRCGVEPGEPALDMARAVAAAPHLTFAGLQAYHGSAQHLRGWDERRQAIAQAVDKAGRTRELLERHGIECPVVTGAGTGSFEFEAASGVYTELQCGSYIFIDADYGRNRDRDGGPFTTFKPRLYVCATGGTPRKLDAILRKCSAPPASSTVGGGLFCTIAVTIVVLPFSTVRRDDAGALLGCENVEKIAQGLVDLPSLVVADQSMMQVAQPF